MPDRCTDPSCEQHDAVKRALAQINPEWQIQAITELPPSGATLWEDIQRAMATVAAAPPVYTHDCLAEGCADE